MLSIAWNPVTELIYAGGLFSQLLAFNTYGDLVSSVTPFIQSREMLFLHGDLYAISATCGLLIRYCLDKEHQICQFRDEKPFMDLRYNPVSQRLLTTTESQVFLLNPDNLTQTHTLPTP